MKKFAEGGSTNEEGAQPNQQADRIINNKFRELWDKNLLKYNLTGHADGNTLLSEMQSGQGNSSAGDRVLVPAEKPDGDRHPEPVGGKGYTRRRNP